MRALVIAARIIVGVLAVAGALGILLSVLRTVVLPRAVPARLARLAFLAVRSALLLRLRLARRPRDYETRDHVFALQAPIGLFAQLLTWGSLLFLCFSALFWSVAQGHLSGRAITASLEDAGSAMLTLGFQHPRSLAEHFTAFAAAAVGLALVALVISYLPSLYNAFSRREAQIAKLVVRAGAPPSGPSLLVRSWELGRFERMEEVWDSWEEWFIDIGETHTTFPQLGFFRSPHSRNHWVLAAEAVLDGANLLISTCDVPRQSRAELCLDAGAGALVMIADFLGIRHRPPAEEEVSLPRERFDDARRQLAERGVPLHDDPDARWAEFRRRRANYEHLLAELGRMTDAPRSEWSSWPNDGPRHSPPLLRL
jgi:hypothetical protein